MSTHNEFGNIAFDLPKNKSNLIKVIGVGGGGSNAINHMFQQGIVGVDFVICNTDAQALHSSGVPNKIQLGVSLTEGLGAGANPEVGEQAALESLEDIKRMLETNTKMVFLTAGMGGGTGTGAAPIIAKLAKELDILTVGIVTMPFLFEGKMRNEQAQIGIEKLRNHVDSLVVINNNKLREVYGNLGFKAGFSKADEVLSTAARGIAEVITHHYTQNIDLRDAKTVLSNSGTAIMGSAEASGASRSQEAIMKALDSPLLNDNKITGAKNVLLLIVSGSKEITIDEIGEINDHIQNEAGHGANIIMGVGEDPELEDAIEVTIIATGFNIDQQNEISNTETKKIIHALDDTVSHPLTTKSITEIKPKTVTNTHSQVLRHTLIDDTIDKNETTLNTTNTKTNFELISTTDVLKDMSVCYEEVLDISPEEFVITDVALEDVKEAEFISSEEQMTFTFDLPINQSKISETNTTEAAKEKPLLFQLEDDLKSINVNLPSEVSPNTVAKHQDEKRYVLDPIEEYVDTKAEKESFVSESTETIVFEKKIISEIDDVADSKIVIDPMNSSISDLLKARATERRQKMKDFNYKFNISKIDEIEKEPAYKRQGVSLEDTQSGSDVNASRLSVSTDDNNELQLRTNNSYLHDNVD